MPVECPT
jgi:hypothetical protein